MLLVGLVVFFHGFWHPLSQLQTLLLGPDSLPTVLQQPKLLAACIVSVSTECLAVDWSATILLNISEATCWLCAAGHESWVLSVACHPSGSCFATGSSDSKVKLWDMSSRSCAQTLTEHSDQVWDVAFNAAGNRFASVSDDKNVALYSFQQ